MRQNLLAVALAALAATALAVGGVAGVSPSAPDRDVQPAERPTVDDYEFAVTDHDDWLADRDATGREVVERLFADDETGSELRDLFDTDQSLAVDVYGSLQRDADAAHVVVTPAPGIDASSPSEQTPRVEAVVDLGDDTVELVGASGPGDADENATTLNVSALDAVQSVTATNATGDAFVVRTVDGEIVDGDGAVAVEIAGVGEAANETFTAAVDEGAE